MSSKSKKTAKPSEPKLDQVNLLTKSVDTSIRCYIDCCICGDEEYDDDTTVEDFVHTIINHGWGYDLSEAYAIVGSMCPKCYPLDDADRGKD